MPKPINRAAKNAMIFLRPPHSTKRKRNVALASAAVLARQVVELSVLAGRDDLALCALDLAHNLERNK